MSTWVEQLQSRLGHPIEMVDLNGDIMVASVDRKGECGGCCGSGGADGGCGSSREQVCGSTLVELGIRQQRPSANGAT
jgi:hypothetical protein